MSSGCKPNCAHHRPVRLSSAKLLKRVFDLDLEHCPNCGDEMKTIAAILEQPVIEWILTNLGFAGQDTTPCAEPWSGAASGLMLPQPQQCRRLRQPGPLELAVYEGYRGRWLWLGGKG